jgi:energy-coupling factor transport system permease protein
MDLRGFGTQRRTWLRQLALDVTDRLVLSGFALLLAVVTILSFLGLTQLWVPEVLQRLAE